VGAQGLLVRHQKVRRRRHRRRTTRHHRWLEEGLQGLQLFWQGQILQTSHLAIRTANNG
jgi:hypothetical protein